MAVTMIRFRFRKIILSLAFLVGVLAVTKVGASTGPAQNIINALVAKMERSEFGRIELFCEDLTDLTQTNITPRYFAALKTSPHLLDDPGFAEAFHKTYVDTADKLLRSEIGSAVRSLDATLLPRSASVDIRLSITFYDRNDNEIATLYFSCDGAVGAVNFDEVEFKGSGLFELLKRQYVDPQVVRVRRRDEIRQAQHRAQQAK